MAARIEQGAKIMQMREFRPAYEFAQKYGAKSLVYGKPGTGKTPVSSSAPRPLLAVVEPGMLSMRKSNIPAVDCFTPQRCDEFFAWLFSSQEARNFDTICIDSVSQMAEIYLAKELGGTSKAGNQVDGRKAYGNMARKMMEHFTGLYYMQQKHTYLICKEEVLEIGNIATRRPYFPGKELNTKIPHLYDVILHIEDANIPGVGVQRCFRTMAGFDCFARDRSGMLAEFEPLNLTALFGKVMQ